MIEINYSLHAADGGITYQERPRSEHVPHIGELITFDPDHSYQVIDVLWHHVADKPDAAPWVTITAHELGWHQHIQDATTAWRHRTRPETD